MLMKTIDISAISFHKMLQVARKIDAVERGGSLLALTYVAAQRVFTATTTWPMQKRFLNPLPAVSDISTDATRELE